MSGERDGRASGERGFVGRWSTRKREAERALGEDARRARRGDGGGSDSSPTEAIDTDPMPVPPPPLDGGAGDGASAGVPLAPAERPLDDDADRYREGAVAEAGTEGPPPPGDADMPPLETLDARSDLSPFFSRGVSAALRRAALRHVFSLPAYNVRDGLNDYDGDYTAFEPLGDTVTADMKFHAARRERERLAREAERAEREDEERAEDESRDAAAARDASGEGGRDEAGADGARDADRPAEDARRDDTDADGTDADGTAPAGEGERDVPGDEPSIEITRREVTTEDMTPREVDPHEVPRHDVTFDIDGESPPGKDGGGRDRG